MPDDAGRRHAGRGGVMHHFTRIVVEAFLHYAGAAGVMAATCSICGWEEGVWAAIQSAAILGACAGVAVVVDFVVRLK